MEMRESVVSLFNMLCSLYVTFKYLQFAFSKKPISWKVVLLPLRNVTIALMIFLIIIKMVF